MVDDVEIVPATHTADVVMQDEVVLKEVDEEVKQHLLEAEKNKQLNAQLQKEQKQINIEHKDFNKELTDKLDMTHDA